MSRTVAVPPPRTAGTFVERLAGLMMKRDLRESFLFIPRCDAVHTCFMSGPIDVAFLDSSRRVTSLHRRVAPWRFLRCRGADSVYEAPAGYFERSNLNIGDEITWLSD